MIAIMDDSTTHSIYRIVCFPTGKVYVGRTINPAERKTSHFSSLKSNRHINTYLQASYNKYGKGSFYFEVIEKGIPTSQAPEREMYWVAHFDSYRNGFNGNPGGDIPTQNMKKCVWNGIEYESISAAARAIGITPSALNFRYKLGYVKDSDVNSPEKNGSISCKWNGIEYHSIRAAAIANGVPDNVMLMRIRNGYTCEEDIAYPRVACTWNGVSYVSINQAAIANGLKNATLIKRLAAGYASDDDMPKRGWHQEKKCHWNGIEYDSIKEAAKANGLNYNTLNYHLRQGHQCDEDIKRP